MSKTGKWFKKKDEMKTTKAVYKLYADCPYCNTRNGLVSLPSIERAYIQGVGGAPVTTRCWKCAEEFGVLPVREDCDPHYHSEPKGMLGAKTADEVAEANSQPGGAQ